MGYVQQRLCWEMSGGHFKAEMLNRNHICTSECSHTAAKQTGLRWNGQNTLLPATQQTCVTHERSRLEEISHSRLGLELHQKEKKKKHILVISVFVSVILFEKKGN